MLSIYPTRHFLSRRQPLKAHAAPTFDSTKLRVVSRVIRLELVAVVILDSVRSADGAGSRLRRCMTSRGCARASAWGPRMNRNQGA
jgi:hypothetical protein